MKRERYQAANEEGHIGWPYSSKDSQGGGKEYEDGGGRADSVLEGEVEELVVGVLWGIEHSVETDQDGLDRARAVAPEGEEVEEDPPHHPAEVIGGVMGEQGDPGQGARGGVQGRLRRPAPAKD